MILDHKEPIFGTQWAVDKSGKPFLIMVENFHEVNRRRSNYGLDPVRRPVNLAIGAVKYPLGRGFAKAKDQKRLTKEEYNEYSRYFLKRES